MNDQDLMHGEDYAGQDVDGWLASEKAEGVCLAWDGALLWTRSGRNITAPTWFLSALPRGQRIIGELWAGPARASTEEARGLFSLFFALIAVQRRGKFKTY